MKNFENKLFFLYFTGFYFGWFASLARAELLLVGRHNILQGMAFLCQVICVVLIIIKYKDNKVPKLKFTNFKFYGFLLFAIWITLIGAPLFSSAPTRIIGALVSELSVFLFILSGIAFCFFTPTHRKILILCFIPLIIIATLVSRTVDVGSLVATTSRQNAFEQTGLWQRYAFQMGVGSASAMLFLISITTLRSLFLSGMLSIGMLLWLYSSLIYSKRQGLLELSLIITFLLLYFSVDRRFKKFRIRIVFTTIVVLTTIVVYTAQKGNLLVLLDRVYDRFFLVQYDGLENFDRLREVIYVFERTSFVQFLLGRGLLSFDLGLSAVYNMHSGFINLMFKGGIFFTIFSLAALGSNVLLMFKHPEFPHRKIVIFCSVYMIVQMIYAPFWGMSPNLFWMGIVYFSPEVFLAISKQKVSYPLRNCP